MSIFDRFKKTAPKNHIKNGKKVVRAYKSVFKGVVGAKSKLWIAQRPQWVEMIQASSSRQQAKAQIQFAQAAPYGITPKTHERRSERLQTV